MASAWQNSFAQLQEFIKDNPTIEITENCIAIPGDIRPEFYRLFDIVRTDFLKDNFPSSLEKGYEISKEFARIYGEAIAASTLESISVRAAVNWFLQDPINGLMRSLFDPIFSLIRGKFTEQTFTENAITLVDNAFSDFFRHGYEAWTVLGLLTLMHPDKNYFASFRDFHTDPEVAESTSSPGSREESVEAIVESKKLSFAGSSITSFIVPRTVFHSPRLGRYVSIHTDFSESYWRARTKSEKMEWLSIKDLTQEYGRTRLWPDLLVYSADKVEDLNLVADYLWVARPDIIIEVEEEDGWYEKGGLDIARRHVAALKPRLGCYILCRNTPPAEVYDEVAPKSSDPQEVVDQASDVEPDITTSGAILDPQAIPESIEPPIHIINTGYDFKTLDAIVKAMEGTKITADN